MAIPRPRRPLNVDWETHMRRQNEEYKAEMERRKREENERINAQVLNLSFRNFGNHPDQERLTGGSIRDAEGAHELEARCRAYAFETAEPLPTPPPSIHSVSPDDTIRDLQSRIDSQSADIQSLESELRSEKVKVRDLQSQRQGIIAAQRDAILASQDAELERLKKQTRDLSELLNQSMERQKDLEQQVDEGQTRERELKRQLQDVEAHSRNSVAVPHADEVNQEVQAAERENAGQERQDTAALSDRQPHQMTRAMRAAAFRRETLAQELAASQTSVVSYPSVSGRSRRHSRQMDNNGYVSMPKGSGRRGYLTLG